MAFALIYLPDTLAALREARRVLSDGATLSIATWNGEPTFVAHLAWVQVTHAYGGSSCAMGT